MRIYLGETVFGWVSLLNCSNQTLATVIRSCSSGGIPSAPSSPNGPISDADFGDQARIILFAREMGWL